MAAPLHININGTWTVNPIYRGEDGESDPYANYANAQRAEAGTYGDGGGVGGSGDSAQDKMFGYLDKAADKAFGYQERTMARTNEYRTKEGATQGQMDDRAFQRLNAELETRKYTQAKGAELTNWQRDQDQKRAITSFKSIGN
jgi:hypothetical protein